MAGHLLDLEDFAIRLFGCTDEVDNIFLHIDLEKMKAKVFLGVAEITFSYRGLVTDIWHTENTLLQVADIGSMTLTISL